MKRLLLCLSLLVVAATAVATVSFAQSKKPVLSPPATASASIGGKAITIVYASPRVRGRDGHIFTKDGLISKDPHYPVWRAGANAATTLKTEADLSIGDLSVPAGTYTLFADVSNPDQWTLIVSKETGEWGLAYNGADDLGRVDDAHEQAGAHAGGPSLDDHQPGQRQRPDDRCVGKSQRFGSFYHALMQGRAIATNTAI